MVLRILPHHGLSRLIMIIAWTPGFWVRWLIGAYIRGYSIKLEEAESSRKKNYKTLDGLFTRRLKENARPLCTEPNTLMSPCDGRITQIGNVADGTLLQVKKQKLRLGPLLGAVGGGDANHQGDEYASTYAKFCIIYLAPRDCHRVFMPVDGSLQKMIHVPGRLFPVSSRLSNMMANVHQRNERVVCLFETALGRMAIVLVGAMNVGTIETSWHGIVAPAWRAKTSLHYRRHRPMVHLKRGEELGCFHLGSSVIVLLENERLVWNPAYPAGKKLRLGAELASIANREEQKREQGGETPIT